MNAREFLDILHMAERLKDTPRHCTTSKGRTESVAEHSWRISLMAFLLRHEFPELNMDKVVDMCLIPDLGECFTGDIPTFLKTDTDRETEDSLLDRWVKSLPAEISADLTALYREMDEQKTMEAKVYKAMDKLEAVIQHNESPLSTWSDNEYELNKTYAFDTVLFSDWLLNLRKEILADTLAKLKSEQPPREKAKGDKPAEVKPAKAAPRRKTGAKPKAASPDIRERQKKAGTAPAKTGRKVELRRPDRAMWKADGEFDASVPFPAVPAPVQKALEADAEQKRAGNAARQNRKLVADLERDAMIAAAEANMPVIRFPENDNKYHSSRKYEPEERPVPPGSPKTGKDQA